VKLRTFGDVFEECDAQGRNDHKEKMNVDEVQGFITSAERFDLVVETIVSSKD